MVIERKLTLHWEGGRGQIAHSSYSRHQIPSGTLNCLFPCNIPSKDIFFFQISQPAEICLKNKYFEEQVHWCPWSCKCLWDGAKLIRFAESASSNIVLYSRFIWLNDQSPWSGLRQKCTILSAFREQAFRSQINWARAKFQVNFDPRQDFVYFWCENRVYSGLPILWLYIRELE